MFYLITSQYFFDQHPLLTLTVTNFLQFLIGHLRISSLHIQIILVITIDNLRMKRVEKYYVFLLIYYWQTRDYLYINNINYKHDSCTISYTTSTHNCTISVHIILHSWSRIFCLIFWNKKRSFVLYLIWSKSLLKLMLLIKNH